MNALRTSFMQTTQTNDTLFEIKHSDLFIDFCGVIGMNLQARALVSTRSDTHFCRNIGGNVTLLTNTVRVDDTNGDQSIRSNLIAQVGGIYRLGIANFVFTFTSDLVPNTLNSKGILFYN